MRDAVRLLLHGAAIACFQTLPSDETSSGDIFGFVVFLAEPVTNFFAGLYRPSCNDKSVS